MNIKQLRKQTQHGKVEGRERPWLYKSLQRGPSIYITALLIKTKMTPSGVSMLSILIGILGAVALVGPNLYWVVLGIVLCYLNILLDKVDGELARYHNRHSLRGVFLDEINHLVVPPLFFIGTMLHVVLYTQLSFFFGVSVIVTGIAAALAMSFIRTSWSLAPQIFAKKYIKRPEQFALPEQAIEHNIDTLKKRHRGIAAFMYFVHQFQEFFMILLVFFAATLIQLAIDTPLMLYLVFAYGILLPLIFIENTIKGYWAVESRIRNLRDKFLR